MPCNASYARFIFGKFFTNTIILYALLFAQKLYSCKKWVLQAHTSGGLKQPSSANILSVKSTKLRKGTVPRTIASAVVACITPKRCGLENLLSALVSKASGGGPSYKIMPRAKKVAPSTKKRIILSIGALVAVSSEGTQESSPHDRAPEILSKGGPRS
jgi:hypothetical protein